jgi:hypothetical protein
MNQTKNAVRRWSVPVAAFALFLAVGALLPAVAQVTTTSASATDSAESDVIIEATDAPLMRQAKLGRYWTVFRELGSDHIYVIRRGADGAAATKHEIQTLGFFAAFDANFLVKLVGAGRLANIAEGTPITDAAGLDPKDYLKTLGRFRLVKSPNSSTVWLVTPAGVRRAITAAGVFHRFGWEFRDVETVSDSEVAGLAEGEAVTDETVFEEEVQVETTSKRNAAERLKERLSLKGKTRVRQRLLKVFGDPKVYLLDGQGRLRHIASERVANRLGLDLKDLTEVTPEEAAAIGYGDEIGEATSANSLNLEAAADNN